MKNNYIKEIYLFIGTSIISILFYILQNNIMSKMYELYHFIYPDTKFINILYNFIIVSSFIIFTKYTKKNLSWNSIIILLSLLFIINTGFIARYKYQNDFYHNIKNKYNTNFLKEHLNQVILQSSIIKISRFQNIHDKNIAPEKKVKDLVIESDNTKSTPNRINLLVIFDDLLIIISIISFLIILFFLKKNDYLYTIKRKFIEQQKFYSLLSDFYMLLIIASFALLCYSEILSLRHFIFIYPLIYTLMILNFQNNTKIIKDLNYFNRILILLFIVLLIIIPIQYLFSDIHILSSFYDNYSKTILLILFILLIIITLFFRSKNYSLFTFFLTLFYFIPLSIVDGDFGMLFFFTIYNSFILYYYLKGKREKIISLTFISILFVILSSYTYNYINNSPSKAYAKWRVNYWLAHNFVIQNTEKILVNKDDIDFSKIEDNYTNNFLVKYPIEYFEYYTTPQEFIKQNSKINDTNNYFNTIKNIEKSGYNNTNFYKNFFDSSRIVASPVENNGKANFLVGTNGKEKDIFYERVPEVDKDYIYTLISSQFGFKFSILLILSYISMFLSSIYIVKNTNDKNIRIISAGFAGFIFSSFFIHISGNLNILPLTGYPLVLISFGIVSSVVLSIFTIIIFYMSLKDK